MKFILKNLLLFVVITILIFFAFTTKTFYSYCKENQLKMFCPNGYGGIPQEQTENLDEPTIRSLGTAISGMTDLAQDDSSDKYDANGYALWTLKQIDVFEITQYYMLSIFLGLSITFGYNIILSEKFNKILKVLVGYVLPVVIMPVLYFLIRRNNGDFFEVNKLIEFGIIYTIIFAVMYIVEIKSKKALKD